MKQTLVNRGSIDTLTADEVVPTLIQIWKAVVDGYEDVDIDRLTTQAVANAAGTIVGTEIYIIPRSTIVSVHRVMVTAGGFTAAVPLATAGAQIGFYRNAADNLANLWYFLPNGGTALAPTLMTEGSSAAMEFRPGESIYVAATGLPANQSLNIELQIRLRPMKRNRQAWPIVDGSEAKDAVMGGVG